MKSWLPLCKAGKLSFKDVTTYNLDEYVGLDGSHPQSYRYFMDSHLFNLVDIDKTRTHVPLRRWRDGRDGGALRR